MFDPAKLEEKRQKLQLKFGQGRKGMTTYAFAALGARSHGCRDPAGT
jgi:hypothetical protein